MAVGFGHGLFYAVQPAIWSNAATPVATTGIDNYDRCRVRRSRRSNCRYVVLEHANWLIAALPKHRSAHTEQQNSKNKSHVNTSMVR